MESIALVIWLYIMVSSKPKWAPRGQNRIVANWKEGGNIALIYLSIIAIVIAIGLTKAILWMNFLENN